MPVDDIPPNVLTPEDELVLLREKKAKREKALEKERQAAELERLRLEDRFSEELGVLGRDFTIIDASDMAQGFVVLKRGPGNLWTGYQKSKMNEVDTEGFVIPCVVHPTKDEYRKLVMTLPFVAERCANQLARLYGVKGKEDEGKS